MNFGLEAVICRMCIFLTNLFWNVNVVELQAVICRTSFFFKKSFVPRERLRIGCNHDMHFSERECMWECVFYSVDEVMYWSCIGSKKNSSVRSFLLNVHFFELKALIWWTCLSFNKMFVDMHFFELDGAI